MSLWSEKKLRLLVTSKCNISCYYCHNEGQPKKQRFMSDELLDGLCQLIAMNNDELATITVSGGEPLLHPDIEIILRKLRLFCTELTVVTNGYLLDRPMLDSLLRSRITKIRIGLDSVTKPSPRPTMSPPPETPIVSVIDMVLSQGIALELNVVLSDYNAEEIPLLLQFCHSRRISSKFFEYVRVSSFGNEGATGRMEPKPKVDFEFFHITMTTLFPTAQHGYTPGMGQANYQYEIDGLNIKYCKYLCPYGLCFKSGTRIDASGHVFVCMKQRGQAKLNPGEPLQMWANKIRQVVEQGCNIK